MKYFIVIFLPFFYLNLLGQELKIDVSVRAPSLMETDPKIIEKLEREISDLYNNSVWTDDTYEGEELIEGNIQLNILEDLGNGNFKGELIVKSSRPVYNSTYNTTIVSIIDKSINFSYDGVAPLVQTTDGYIDNLSAILSFYAYFLIGMDYDTFSIAGGNPHFNNAQNLYNNLPSNIQNSDGWSKTDGKQQNRYWLLENVNNPKLRLYREVMYEYHRRGLDIMYEDHNKSRAVLLSAITRLAEVNNNYNNSVLLKMFSDAKRNELIEIFNIAEQGQKKRIYNIMTQIDPSQSSAYKDFR